MSLTPPALILTFVKFWPEMCILVACDDGQMDPTFNHSGLVLMLIQKVMFFFFNPCPRYCSQVERRHHAFGIVCTFPNVKIATCFFGD